MYDIVLTRDIVYVYVYVYVLVSMCLCDCYLRVCKVSKGKEVVQNGEMKKREEKCRVK